MNVVWLGILRVLLSSEYWLSNYLVSLHLFQLYHYKICLYKN